MKKKIALVLTMAMLGSCLAGCGQNADDNGAASDQKDSTTVAQSTETAQGTEAGEKEWFGTDDGKTVTIRLWGGVQPEYGYDEVTATLVSGRPAKLLSISAICPPTFVKYCA